VDPLEVTSWEAIDGWAEDDLRSALGPFLMSCRALRNRPGWEGVCADALTVTPDDPTAVRAFFESRFVPYRVNNPNGSDSGLITGYYVPDLLGSKIPSERFAHPIYAVPDDLLVIDLRSVYPDLANYRLRGRLQGRKVVPYYDRAQIESDTRPLKGKEICWVEDPVDLYFMQVQGTGRITLNEGGKILVHYADQNGHPYRSIGKLLLDKGAMTREQMSMQNIKSWVAANPEDGRKLLDENPSYVFFREGRGDGEVTGALGVPLSSERSVAIDPRTVPLGAPVFLATTRPGVATPEPLKRLMMGQDTGGAIKGAVRADFFWGLGDVAGYFAGRMKHTGRMWVLLPAGMTPPGKTPIAQ
jgi:membrane-bound lytic murein transglycosylase A